MMRSVRLMPWCVVMALGGLLVPAGAAQEGRPKGNDEGGTRSRSTATATAPADEAAKPEGPPRVVLEITQDGEAWGSIVLELDAEKAPITTKNFLQYVDEGFYDGTVFHRVMPNFMIQGGGFASLDEQKTAGLRKPIRNEARNGLKNQRGTIAMARTRAPHSATSQFFINVVDNANLDYPSFDGVGYCAFGKVVDGMDVVDRIKGIETRPNPANPREKSQPVNPPKIKSARRAGPMRRVLILCSGNASRSQMAEGLWRKLGGSNWEVFSAGIAPKDSVDPLAIKAMKEIGIDISKQKSKSVQAFVDQPFDLVVTVCSDADAKCPTFPKAKRRVHWPVDNPSQAGGTDDEKLRVFRKARDQLKAAIERELKQEAKPAGKGPSQ